MRNVTRNAKSRVAHESQTRFTTQSAIQHGDEEGTEIERVGVKERGLGSSDSGSLACYDLSICLHFFCVPDHVQHTPCFFRVFNRDLSTTAAQSI